MSDAGPPAPDPRPGEDDEEGTAAERTMLAWSRSGLALMACGAAVFKGLPLLSATPSEPVAGTIILVLGGVVWIVGSVSRQRRAHSPHGYQPAVRSDLLPIAVGTAGVGIVGMALVVFKP
jgi:uncharacterized membrane protein YidH (DUF202 family)